MSMLLGMARFLAFLILGLLVLIVILATTSPREAPTSTVSSGSGTYSMTQNTWGCRTVDDLREIAQLRSQGDNAAVAARLGQQIDAGNCITLDTGERVYLMDAQPLAGLSQVRKEGQTQAFWVALEAVQ